MDEALFSDMTHRLIQGFDLSTSLFRDFIPEVERHAYWYPPLYFLLLAPLVTIFGISVYAMRILSLVAAATTLLLIFTVARQVFAKRWLGVIAVCLLVFDYYFQTGAVVGRMELVTILFGYASIVTHLHFLKHRRQWLNVSSGTFAAAACMTHPTGSIFLLPIVCNLLFMQGKWQTKVGNLVAVVLPTIIAIGFWYGSFYSNWESFLLQNQLQLHRKQFGDIFLWQIFQFLPKQRLVLAGILLSEAVFLWRTITNKQLHNAGQRLLFFLVLTSSVLSVVLKEMWYIVYIPVVGVLAVADTCAWLWSKRPLVSGIVICAFLLPNVLLYFDGVGESVVHRSEYAELSRQIAAILPPNARVLLSSLPDPYFYLRQHRPDLDLRETPNSPPAEPIDPDVYNTILSQVEYVVFSYTLNRHLREYYQNNLEAIIFTQSAEAGYPLQIFKLKPPDQRLPVTPNADEVWQYPAAAR